MQSPKQNKTELAHQQPTSLRHLNIQPINAPQYLATPQQQTGYQPESTFLSYPLSQSQYTMEPPFSHDKISGGSTMRSNPLPSVEDITVKVKERPYTTNVDGVPYRADIFCTKCQKSVVTNISSRTGKGTFVWCFLLSFVSPFCCLIPFCISNCKDKIHTCPSCKSKVGHFEYQAC